MGQTCAMAAVTFRSDMSIAKKMTLPVWTFAKTPPRT